MRFLPYLLLGVAGVITATVGTSAHRAYDPWGLILALVAVAAVGFFARALRRWAGFGVYGLVLVTLIGIYSMTGPNGSVLIAGDSRGYIWIVGSLVVLGAVALIPRRLIEGSEIRESSETTGAERV